MNNFKDAFIQYGLDHGHIKPIKETVKKTKAKKGVFFKNKKIAKNAEDLFTKILTQ